MNGNTKEGKGIAGGKRKSKRRKLTRKQMGKMATRQERECNGKGEEGEGILMRKKGDRLMPRRTGRKREKLT